MNASSIIAIIFLLVIPLWAIAATIIALKIRSRSRKNSAAATEKQLLLESDISEKMRTIDALTERYSDLIDRDAEIRRLENMISDKVIQLAELRSEYSTKHETYNAIVKQIAVYDEKLAFAEMGVYEPHFEFDDSEQYKRAISAIRDEQKQMISSKSAVVCHQQWQVDGSLSKGQVMTNRNIRLTLRAFNNECDAAIANVRWNNVNAMEKRIINAKEQLDKLNESNAITVTDKFTNLKLKELYLSHEHRERLKAEREERAELSRAAREEQKLIRDLERAEEEESRYKKLLQKARDEAASASGNQFELYNAKISLLEKDLAEAHARFERAQALAEKTRSGYVYVISNIGSFGESVVKIGLTRRLDPSDRIRELGDASVPFVFDTHAIIYSDDAPALERALHSEFEGVRINTQNFRKEFFRVSIDEVEVAVRKIAPDAPFFKDVEAQEYRETLARRNASLSAEDQKVAHAFPDAL